MTDSNLAEPGNPLGVEKINHIFEAVAVEMDLANPRFVELNAEELVIHRAKAAGYSGSGNPDTWANFREARAWGVEDWRGACVRLGDKYRRAQNILTNPANEQVGESVYDTLMDLSNYAKIVLCLWEEAQQARLIRKTNDVFTVLASNECAE